MISNLRDCRVTVMGLGSFGGGIGVVRYLRAQGARVTVTDLKPGTDLSDSLAKLGDCPEVTFHLGSHREQDFREADLVVASPAIPLDNRYLQVAREAGVPISSEMNLFWERNRGQTICVTGSNGKSTTTALLHSLLTSAGVPAVQSGVPEGSTDARPAPRTVWLGGNIGHSLLPEVERIAPDDWVVLELSSFQLEALAQLKPNPHVAIVTNFSPNHLDRHGDIAAYRSAKMNLLRWQTADRIAILNQSDPEVSQWRTAAKRLWFGRDDEGRQGVFAVGFEGYKRRALYRSGVREQVLPMGDWLHLPGAHNFQNALAATCAALAIGVGIPAIAEGMRSFRGLPHRLQFVAEVGGRKFYNDSKATTPAAAIEALEAFRAPIVLLAGGYDKQLDLSEFAREIVQRGAKAVALLGQTAEALQQALRAVDPDGRVVTKAHVTFDGAFRWATSQSTPGDVVLLSPGCASYDWFPNYEARGDEFNRLVQQWPNVT